MWRILLSITFVLTLVAACIWAARAANKLPETARTGPQLFSKYCVSCHGKDGRAKTLKAKFNHARDISDAKWQDEVTDERIFNSILNGRSVRGNMPAFGRKITEQEAEALVTYVRGLRK
ncbi:MAG: cytochrome c [Pyrinomonadaceae bacterium]